METEAAEISPREKIAAAMAALGLSVSAEFVPFSQSRNKDSDHRSFNWRVTLSRDIGGPILTTDYGAGIAHAPAYKLLKMGASFGRTTLEQRDAIEFETEKGRAWRRSYLGIGGPPILPEPESVVWSLVQDASVLDSGGFEEWASELGYDTDSRSAESTYRACLELALKLRGAIGDAGIEALRTAGEDF